MLNAILAALRTSEFWAFLLPVIMEAMSAPVPEDVKMFSWAYAALRVIGKVAKYIFPDGTKGKWLAPNAAVALAMLGLATPAMAQVEPVPITAVSERFHVMAQGGGIFLTTGDDWSGASLGGTVVYNLHQNFSVFGGYDHGFPVNDVDRSLDFKRVVGNVRIHPNAGAGFGYGWFGNGVEGGLAQLVVSKMVMPRLSLAGLYAHVFSDGDLDDFEYAKVYLNYHLLGKE